jgi:DNA-binding PadR family transcriptional regulator
MSYALLGLLSLRSWTGYELTQQVRRSLTHVWPASAANLYREQQRLVRLGWATVDIEPAGPERTRHRYTITAAGRAALGAWLDDRPGPANLESEAFLRIWFADAGTPDQLARTLRATAEEARATVDHVAELFEQYLAGGGPFPERAHLNAIAGELIADLFGALEHRCATLAAEVEQWRSTRRDAMDEATRQRMERVVARTVQR